MEEQGDMDYYESNDNVRRVVDMLRSVNKSKKSKTKKAQILTGMFGDDDRFYKRILELAEQYAPHCTKIYADMATDIVWDLPSGNHPGLFLSYHEHEGESFFTGSVTAWRHLEFPENTADGEMPEQMGILARTMIDQSNSGGISESNLIAYMQEMDIMCAELQNMTKSKTKKDEKKIPVSDDDTVEIEEMDGKRYVEIEPKEEHAEEVQTGYEKESDDLNTEDNITHPDTSKPKKSKTKEVVKMNQSQSMEVCMDYQLRNNRIGLTKSEIIQMTGNDPEQIFRPFISSGRIAKVKCSDGYIYRFRM